MAGCFGAPAMEYTVSEMPGVVHVFPPSVVARKGVA
jgi:hypothetical protein